VKATVFHLEKQDALYRSIERLLRQTVYEAIEIERRVIPNYYHELSESSVHDTCRSYLRMLRACMIRVEDFRIVVGNVPYSWCYLGYEGYGDLETNNFLQISLDNLNAIFPAVAINDRMVMAPSGLHDAFDGSSALPFFLRPLNLQGVALVDFAQAAFLRQEMQQIGQHVEREIVQLCARHAQVRKIQRPDFGQLSELLKVDLSYLEQRREKIMGSLIRLTPVVRSGPVTLGSKSRVVMEISEGIGNSLKRVRVQVKGPKGAIGESAASVLDFTSANDPLRTLTLDVVAKAAPYCPLEIRFESDDSTEAYAAFPIPVILDVLDVTS
jgi:hypothetical protein